MLSNKKTFIFLAIGLILVVILWLFFSPAPQAPSQKETEKIIQETKKDANDDANALEKLKLITDTSVNQKGK